MLEQIDVCVKSFTAIVIQNLVYSWWSEPVLEAYSGCIEGDQSFYILGESRVHYLVRHLRIILLKHDSFFGLTIPHGKPSWWLEVFNPASLGFGVIRSEPQVTLAFEGVAFVYDLDDFTLVLESSVRIEDESGHWVVPKWKQILVGWVYQRSDMQRDCQVEAYLLQIPLLLESERVERLEADC